MTHIVIRIGEDEEFGGDFDATEFEIKVDTTDLADMENALAEIKELFNA